MLNNTIQTIFYDGVYIFRGRMLCFEDVFKKLSKDKVNLEVKEISELQLTTELGKAKMNILLNPEEYSAAESDEAFDYFIQYKDFY